METGLRLAWISYMRINHTLISWVLVAPMSVFLGACGGPQESTGGRGTAVATISNGLPVDGCSYPVTIDNREYAPDPQSIAAISDRVPAGGQLRVRIEYRVTGRRRRVECGFGTSRHLPEITFRVLRVFGQ
jgi:hypothetical protein